MPNFMVVPLTYWRVVRRRQGGVSRLQSCTPRGEALGYARRMETFRHVGLLAIALCGLARIAPAAPPPDADPSLAPWFNDLRQPWTNALCCSVADCRPVESRLNGDHYEALIEGEWR